MFKVITPVAAEPVSLADARLHLRLGDDETDEDELIAVWITAAREFAEHYAGRALAPQTLEMALDEFPACDGKIILDLPPVTAVTSIKYDDTAGAEQTLATSVYAFSDYGDAREISLKYGQVWPSTYCQANAVRIRYTAGAANCPKAARSAILLTVGHFFENRQEVLAGSGFTSAVQLPLGARSLLDTIKVY